MKSMGLLIGADNAANATGTIILLTKAQSIFQKNSKIMKVTKILITAFSILLVAATGSSASISEGVTITKLEVKTNPKKTEITPSELPEAVKKSIMESDYAQWNIVKAYIITYSDDAEKVEYEVHFTNEKGKKSKQIEVYDKEGELIEE